MPLRPRRVVLLAALVTAVGPIPAFAVGANAGPIRTDLGLSVSQFGLVIALFGVVQTVGIWQSGSLVERWGARRTLVWSCSVCALVLLGVASVARGFTSLGILLMIAGLANAVSQPAGNLATAAAVSPAGQGFAFGAKQAAIPLASVLVGVMVPLISAPAGWQASFLVLCAIAVAAAIWSRRLPAAIVHRGPNDAPWRPAKVTRVVMRVGFLAACCGNALTAFFVDSLVVKGWSNQSAALWLTVGGMAAAIGRVVLGRFADAARVAPDRMAAITMVCGSLGFALLALPGGTPLLGVATVVSFGLGWAWPGLMLHVVVRADLSAARSTARVQTGTFAAGAVGPAGFGFIADHWSYAGAWLICAGVLIAAATLLVAGMKRS